MFRYPHTFAVEPREFSQFVSRETGPTTKEWLDPLISLSSSLAKLCGLEFRQVFRESCHVLGVPPNAAPQNLMRDCASRGGGGFREEVSWKQNDTYPRRTHEQRGLDVQREHGRERDGWS